MRLVSIGMPVYNEEEYIEKTIISFLNQDYKNIELIISDNGSTDGTKEICCKYLEKDSRIRYFPQKKTSDSTSNFNFVTTQAKGEYFMWAAGHDLREPNYISKCQKMLETSKSIVLCYTDAIWIDINGNNIGIESSDIDTRGISKMDRYNKVFWNLGYAYPIYGLFRMDALNKVLPYKKKFGPDVLLLNELSIIGEFAHIKEPLLYIRRLSDFGDWNAYLKKCLGRNTTYLSAISLYLDFFIQNYRIINKHLTSPSEKIKLLKITILGSTKKYQGLLTALVRSVLR